MNIGRTRVSEDAFESSLLVCSGAVVGLRLFASSSREMGNVRSEATKFPSSLFRG